MEGGRQKTTAPFPYFGGKATVAETVWRLLGDPRRYIEPFAGSAAVLLNRPRSNNNMEIINDLDGFVTNAFRSIRFKPKETAYWADCHVNHIELFATRKLLLKSEELLVKSLTKDIEWCDPKLGGRWIWAASTWIGSGLTTGGMIDDGVNAAVGIKGQIPILTRRNGVNSALLSDEIYQWFDKLSARLRNVMIFCGDWSRTCGGNWQGEMGTCGIFFDPPYQADEIISVYAKDSRTVAKDVTAWALERGKLPNYRIVIAGYEEHEELLGHGWKFIPWKANGGYSNRAADNSDNNCHRERLYYSPYCLSIPKMGRLF